MLILILSILSIKACKNTSQPLLIDKSTFKPSLSISALSISTIIFLASLAKNLD